MLMSTPEKSIQFAKNGLAAVKKRYNWENEEQKLLEIYRELSESSIIK
jgi:hypothetical protein